MDDERGGTTDVVKTSRVTLEYPVEEEHQLLVRKCEVCGKRKGAAIWNCLDCKKWLCQDCRDSHRRIDATRNHKVKFIDDYTKSIKPHEMETEKKKEEKWGGKHLLVLKPADSSRQNAIIDSTYSMKKKSKNKTIESLIKDSSVRRVLKVDTGNNSLNLRSLSHFCRNHGTFQCRYCFYGKNTTDKRGFSPENFVRLKKEYTLVHPGDRDTPYVSGTAFLADSRLLSIDAANKKLKVLGLDSGVLDAYTFESPPFAVAVFDKDEVSVSLPTGMTIFRFAVGQTIVKRGTIPTRFHCYGVDYLNRNCLVVTGYDANVLAIINIDGVELRRLSNESFVSVGLFSGPRYCAVDRKNKLSYVSNYLSNAICEINLTTMKASYIYEDIHYPMGLYLEGDGALYVCCPESNNVIKIENRSRSLDIYLTHKDGVKHPNTITFAADGYAFAVGETSKIKLYKVM